MINMECIVAINKHDNLVITMEYIGNLIIVKIDD